MIALNSSIVLAGLAVVIDFIDDHRLILLFFIASYKDYQD